MQMETCLVSANSGCLFYQNDFAWTLWCLGWSLLNWTTHASIVDKLRYFKSLSLRFALLHWFICWGWAGLRLSGTVQVTFCFITWLCVDSIKTGVTQRWWGEKGHTSVRVSCFPVTQQCLWPVVVYFLIASAASFQNYRIVCPWRHRSLEARTPDPTPSIEAGASAPWGNHSTFFPLSLSLRVVAVSCFCFLLEWYLQCLLSTLLVTNSSLPQSLSVQTLVWL
jgi:hypothetical protein